ncbi:MAG: hypothetical protein MJZ15_01255, partial [Bacteroidales bacterium]|nr:hypothetical protein [Bacteroidales bacterium]
MKTFNIYSTLLAVLAFFASTMTATAETITSVKEGHWFAPDTWDLGRVPGENDDVVIAEGFSVDGKKADGNNTGADFKVASLVVNGTLTQNSGKKLTITGAVTIASIGKVVVVNDFVPATIDNYGKLEVQGTTTASQYIYNHEGAEINFTASGKTLKASANRTDAVVNEGRVTNADGKVNYINVVGPTCFKAEQLTEFRDNGGFVYLATIDYSHYAGKTFHFGAGSEFAAEYDNMNWNTPYVWPENYIAKNVLYDYYPGKAVHQYVDDVIIPSGKTCTYNANVNNVGTFTIESGAIWNANDNRTLFLNGQFINNGTIRVNENKTLTIYGEGSVVNNYGSIENNSANKSGAKISIVSGIEFKDHDISKGEGSYVYGGENENRKITVSVLAPVTYYWKGTSGNWKDVANWFFDPEFKNQTNAAPNSATIHVVIPEGQTCYMEDNKSVASLTINGTLTNAAKTLTSYGDVVVNGTIDAANKITFTVHGNFIANSTASVNFKNGADFKVLGNATVNTDITTSNDIKFYMADNTNVNLNKKITFTAAKSITVGSYANINLDGNNIKVNLGDDCSFVSNNIASNLYAFPSMIDWQSEDIYKHFTYTKGAQKMRLYLRARPEGEQTFYFYPFADNTPVSGNWWDDYKWSLVDKHCVYIKHPVNYSDSKPANIAQYYPGLMNDAFDGLVDNAIIPTGVTVTLDRNIRCLGSLTIEGTGILKVNTGLGLNPLCGNLVTINSLQSLAVDANNIADDAVVHVKTKPDTDINFYATKDGVWDDDAMWSLKEGKKWYVIDGEGKAYVPNNQKDNVIIPADIEISLNDDYTVGNLTVNGGLDLGRDNNDMTLSVGFLLGDGNITMKRISNLYIRDTDDKWDGDMVIEAEETGTMFYASKSGRWDDPTTWTTDPALRPVKLNTWPGKDSNADMVSISAGKSVTTNVPECKIASLNLKGELKVENRNSVLVITGEVSGEGKLDVYDINKNFQVYRKKLNTFYPKGTVVIRESCELPANEFGNLDVYAKNVRICGDIRINNNLTIRKNGELIMGRDLYELTIDGVTYGNWDDAKNPEDGNASGPLRTVFKAMAAAGRKSPEAMNIFFNAFVGGDVLLEENATLKASHIDAFIKRARSSEGGIGWPTWSWINFQGDVVLQKGAEINFYDPYKFNYSKYPNARITPITMGNVDRLVNMVFSGSKNAKFEIADGAHVYTSQIVCQKDENAEIYINPETSECLYSLARAGRPDEDYWIYAYHIRSGIMHLGPNVVIKAWGSTRTRNGEPTVRNRTYDIMHLESDIPLKHGTFVDKDGYANDFEYNFSTQFVKSLTDNLKTYPTAYTFVRRERTLASELSEAFFFDQTRASGLFIPENGQLWIDGAYVDLGVADEYGSGLLDYVYDNTKDPATNGNDKAFFYGFVDLRGKLRVSNGGKLIMPDHSVGIFYDSPNVDRCSTAAEIIMEGESSEIHTSRIYGMHDRQLNFKMTGGTLYFDRRTPISAASFKYKNNGNSANQTYLIDPVKTNAIRQRGGVANADGSYREEGCIFYMANGGTFNMSGGRIYFQNVEEGTTTPHAINTLNLRNCSGLVSGGTIIFDQAELKNMNYLPFTNYIPENIKLNNLTVTNSRKVEFWGTPTLTSDKGFSGHSLYVNGTLCLGYNPVWVPASEDGDDEEALVGHFNYSNATKTNSWFATPENLYVAGDLYFGSTDGNHKLNTGGKYPMTFGVNFEFTNTKPYSSMTFPNLIFTGLNDQKMTTISASPFWNNITVSKSDSKAKVTLYGKDIYVFGDFEAIRGKILPGDGETNAFVTMRNGLKVQNVVQGGADGDMSAITLHFKNYHDGYDYNGTQDVNFKTDVVLGRISVDANNDSQRQFFLGEHNLKCVDGLTFTPKTGGFFGIGNITDIDKAFENYPFVCTSSIAQGGLTLPLSGTSERQFFMATEKNGNLLKTTVTVAPRSAVDGYLTIVPCNEYHPSLDDMSNADKSSYATEYYWRVKWDGTSTDPAFNYTFYCPLNVGRLKSGSRYLYNYYEYCTPTGETTPRWIAVHVIDSKNAPNAGNYKFNPVNRNSGDFTLGYNYDTTPGTIFYSVASGNWEDGNNWSTSPTGTPVANKVPGLKDIAVVQAGHVVTVNDPNQKSGFISINGTLVVKPSATGLYTQQFIANDDKTTYTADGEHTLIYETNGTSAAIINGDHTNLCINPEATVAYVNTGSTEYVVPSVNVIKSYPSLQLVGKVKISDATVGDNQFLTIASDLYAGPKEGSVVATLYGSTTSTVNISPAADAYVEVKGQTITAATGTLNVNRGALNTYGTLVNNGTFKISADASVNVYGDVDQANVTTKKFNVYGRLCFVDNVDQLVDGYEIRFYDGSTLVVDKTESDNKVYFNAYVVTNNASSKLNTDFQKGYLSLQPVNGKNNIYFGDEGGEFLTIPETFTLVASNNNGKGCTLTFQTYLHLDGKLIINDGATVNAYYGI